MEAWEIVVEFLRNAVVPTATALLTVWLVHTYESRRMEGEQNEKILRQLFDRSIDALTQTYEAMSISYGALSRYANAPPSTVSELRKQVLAIVDKWEQIERNNAIWLRPIADEISVVRGEFRLVRTEISQRVRNPNYTMNVRWTQFQNAFSAARDAIRILIPISSLEERLEGLQTLRRTHENSETPSLRVSQGRRPITVDIGFIIALVITTAVVSWVDLPIELFEYIPVAINGLTTATSILVGVAGVLATRYLSPAKTLERRLRVSFYLLILAITSFFVAGAYLSLVMGSLVLAFKISLAIFNICYMVPISLVFHIIYFTD